MRIVDDPAYDVAIGEWFRGGSALPLLKLHIERDEIVEAGAIARIALERVPCLDADEIERLLYTLDEAPDAWDDVLRQFAEQPSLERWRDIMRFVPPDLTYQRVRNTIRRLRALGIDGNLLFLCACDLGMTPDAIQLVEEGCVTAATIEERASIAGEAKSAYFGLAAQAAFLAGDVVATVRFLRESTAHQNEWCSPVPAIFFIRERATPEIAELLDKAGIANPLEDDDDDDC